MRNVLILMLLSCLARAAGDEDLAGQCTRAGGIASIGPGLLAVVMLVFAVGSVETGAQHTTFVKILTTTLQMGIYAIISGIMFPSFMAARSTADACDEPFQSRIPQL